MKRILLVGGGSGGHVYPLIAVAEELKKQAGPEGVDIMLLGEGDFLARAARENGYQYRGILAGKLRRYASILTALDFIKAPISFAQSFWHVFWYMPDAVFSKGGSSSVAPCLVATLFFIPVYIHESDSVSGLANRIIGRFAKKIYLAFESGAASFADKSKIQVVGNPVRDEIFGAARDESLRAFGFSPERKTILVLGGSQGAKKINDTVLDLLVMATNTYQIIHQCGESQFKEVNSAVERLVKEGEGSYAEKIKSSYRLKPFFDSKELAMAYAASDVVISRAGSGLIFEIAALGKPAIIIPLANSAGDHQKANAMEFSRYGAVMIEEANLTRNIILNQVDHILADPSIPGKIKSFIKTDAAAAIAAGILGNA